MKMKPHLHGKRGTDLLHDPLLNKGQAFTEAERDALGLRGLLPPHVATQDEQVGKTLETVRRKPTDLERYIYLISLQERNENLFYRLVTDNVTEMMPLIYTPTVGLACQRYAFIFRRPRGLFISIRDRGRVKQILQNWPHDDVRMIVVTDGERILGLGDLGANGMGIPVGKLSLYTACAGLMPDQCLPVMLDVGTENATFLSDQNYIGTKARRERGPAYDALVAEFVDGVQEIFPRACIQFEDFGNANAFRLLQHYRDKVCCFNDDIQGTAGVTLAGVYSALRLNGGTLANQRFLFLGAGEAGIGIGDLIVEALKAEGVAEDVARGQCWYVDSKGLVVSSRTDLAPHKRRFAHNHPGVDSLLAAVEALKPTMLIGVSGMPQTFTEPIVRAMGKFNQRPAIFALSNPTSKAECTAEQAYTWTEGRAIFASGSPFPDFVLHGRTYKPGQGNNSYIFPGVGLGIICSQAKRVTDEMFFVAAKVLASMVTEQDLSYGRIYPDLQRIREVSANIATAVARVAFQRGLTDMLCPEDLAARVRSQMYEPVYPNFV
ncbi:MAG TPA: NAD-dependent malic enzyme [Opitutaceae bacterium]|nr:NAD-dependent malic enzyme [Opitutaceae bacterium]HND61466.1 NAD-dependent malic enzyme [Opitutaceae bacterium]